MHTYAAVNIISGSRMQAKRSTRNNILHLAVMTVALQALSSRDDALSGRGGDEWRGDKLTARLMTSFGLVERKCIQKYMITNGLRDVPAQWSRSIYASSAP